VAAESASPPLPDAAAFEVDSLAMIGLMAGRVAHEINNPLAGIHNAFLLIKDAVPVSHPHHAYVGTIEREIGRIASITRRLVETYRPEQDRAVGVAVSAIVSDAIRLAVPVQESDTARVQLDNRVHDAIVAPAGLLRHALHQVLERALRSSGPNQPVEVSVRRVGQQVAITVRFRAPATIMTREVLHYPTRLLAALGGGISIDGSEATTTTAELTVPVTAPARAP
jgi:signal transduction histidine kinase